MNGNKVLYFLFFFFLQSVLCSSINTTVQTDILRCFNVRPCFAFEIAQDDNSSGLDSGKESEGNEEPASPEEPQEKEDTKSGPFKKFSPTKKIPAEQAVDFPVDI